PYCHRHQVLEQALVRCVVAKLQRELLNPANLELLREELHRQVAEARSESPRQLGRLRQEITELDAKIDQGSERLLTLPPDVVRDAAAKLREWKNRRQALSLELERARQVPKPEDADAAVAAAEQQLWRLREGLEAADPGLARAVLREMVSRIELRWE